MVQAPEHSKHQWVFIRGLSRESWHWGSFLEVFIKTLDAEVTCIDFPGTGIYCKEKSPSTIEQIVDHVQKHASIPKKPVMLLAHSMGCLVGYEWMKRQPEMFTGAVFTNTSIGKMSSMFDRLRPSIFGSIFQILFSVGNIPKREAIKYSMICNSVDRKETILRDWIQIQHQHPVSISTMFNQLRAAAVYQVCEAPKVPLLLINSLGDHLVHPQVF